MWIDDYILKKMADSIALWCWVPDNTYVVLGASNHKEQETQQDLCTQDNVPVLKRYGGGGTVLLHPGCVIVSVGLWVKDLYQNQSYFRLLNQAIIDSLTQWNPVFRELSQNGLSDICYGSKKVAGTSLFRSRHYLLYQASILIDPKLHLIDRYLKHPSKEPDYRRNRSHADFLMGLKNLLGNTNPSVEPTRIAAILSESLRPVLERLLQNHLIDPQPEHFVALEARIKRSQD